MLASEVLALLDAHQAADVRERGFVQRMRELARASAPFSRQSFTPGHFTASAFVLSPERDALLLIFHKKLSLWLQPGGHVEETDRTILDAARREVLEEVGLEDFEEALSPLFDVDIHDIPARKAEPAHQHFDLRFLFVSKTRAARETDEIGGMRWVPLQDLSTVTTDESVLRAARKIR